MFKIIANNESKKLNHVLSIIKNNFSNYIYENLWKNKNRISTEGIFIKKINKIKLDNKIPSTREKAGEMFHVILRKYKDQTSQLSGNMNYFSNDRKIECDKFAFVFFIKFLGDEFLNDLSWDDKLNTLKVLKKFEQNTKPMKEIIRKETTTGLQKAIDELFPNMKTYLDVLRLIAELAY